jgi:hypothetical protein
MARTLCDWSKKDIERDLAELAEIVAQPRFICKKCARSANSGKYLCKPKRLPATVAAPPK